MEVSTKIRRVLKISIVSIAPNRQINTYFKDLFVSCALLFISERFELKMATSFNMPLINKLTKIVF